MSDICDVLVLHDNGFSAEVASRIVAAIPGATSSPLRGNTAPAPEAIPLGGVILAAVNLCAPTLERELDALVLARGAFLVPIVSEHQIVRVGPVLGPGATATVDCYYRRVLQHYRGTGLAEVHQTCDRDGDRVADGYLPSMAAAVGLLAAAVAQRLAAGEIGDLHQVTVLSGHSARIERARLTGVHGNARSAAPVSERDRSWSALLPLVRELAVDAVSHREVSEGVPV